VLRPLWSDPDDVSIWMKGSFRAEEGEMLVIFARPD
jgi:hypothetical protein